MDDYSPGLEGVIAAKSRLCQIDGALGKLFYMGYPIEELVEGATYEECCYLLWHGRLPTREELAGLKQELIEKRTLPQQVIDFIALLPHTSHPMDALRTVASLLATFDQNPERSPEANLNRAVVLTAQFPTIIAHFHRLRQNQKPVEPHPKLGHAANFLYMLLGKEPDETMARVMDIAMILHLDHEMNASTFGALVTASTLSDLYSAVATGVGALKGSLHGGANEAVLKMLQEIGDPKNVEAFVDDALAKKVKMMVGHRVYKNYDPRAKIPRRNTPGGCQGSSSLVNDKLEKAMVGARQTGDIPQRRPLFVDRLPPDGYRHRPLHADLRHGPGLRLDGPRPRILAGQQALPSQLHLRGPRPAKIRPYLSEVT